MKTLQSFLLTTLFNAVVLNISAQTIYGSILDASTQKPLPFVNIGIIGKANGTVSDENGKFSIELNKNKASDTLMFSMIGYEAKRFTVAFFETSYANKPIIFLKEKTVELKTTEIRSREFKTKILGNTTQSRTMNAGFSSNQLGCEMGVLIKIKRSPTILEDFNFSIFYNELDTLLFRVNIYNIKNGLPADNILKENILVKTSIKNGVVHVDLKNYGVVVYEDFLISLEWLKNYDSKKDIKSALLFSAGLFGNTCYLKDTSQDEWEKLPIIAIGFNTTVKY